MCLCFEWLRFPVFFAWNWNSLSAILCVSSAVDPIASNDWPCMPRSRWSPNSLFLFQMLTDFHMGSMCRTSSPHCLAEKIQFGAVDSFLSSIFSHSILTRTSTVRIDRRRWCSLAWIGHNFHIFHVEVACTQNLLDYHSCLGVKFPFTGIVLLRWCFICGLASGQSFPLFFCRLTQILTARGDQVGSLIASSPYSYLDPLEHHQYFTWAPHKIIHAAVAKQIFQRHQFGQA